MNTREILALRRRMFMRRYAAVFCVPALLCMAWLIVQALHTDLTPRLAVQPESASANAVAARSERACATKNAYRIHKIHVRSTHDLES